MKISADIKVDQADVLADGIEIAAVQADLIGDIKALLTAKV